MTKWHFLLLTGVIGYMIEWAGTPVENRDIWTAVAVAALTFTYHFLPSEK